MATSRTLALDVTLGKKDVTRASSGSADGNVTVVYDRDENQANIIAALEKIKEVIIDQEYRAAP